MTNKEKYNKTLSQVIDDMKEAINKLSAGDPTPLEIVKLIGMTEMLSIATGKRYKITKGGLSAEDDPEAEEQDNKDQITIDDLIKEV